VTLLAPDLSHPLIKKTANFLTLKATFIYNLMHLIFLKKSGKPHLVAEDNRSTEAISFHQ